MAFNPMSNPWESCVSFNHRLWLRPQGGGEFGYVGISDIGYEIDGDAVWFHPYRLDSWETFQTTQLDKLEPHLKEEARKLAVRLLGEENVIPTATKLRWTKPTLERPRPLGIGSRCSIILEGIIDAQVDMYTTCPG